MLAETSTVTKPALIQVSTKPYSDTFVPHIGVLVISTEHHVTVVVLWRNPGRAMQPAWAFGKEDTVLAVRDTAQIQLLSDIIVLKEPGRSNKVK